jgi:hypothetical protein
MAGAFALQPSTDAGYMASKPFDGFKTTTASSKKPFDFRGGKAQSNTEYGGGAIGIAAKEQALMKDIAALDWELKATTQKPGMQSEALLKPKLFVKKKGFNDTGETRATVGTTGNDAGDWDLPGGSEPSAKKTAPLRGIQTMAAKENADEATDWHLDKFDSKGKGKITASKK